MSCGGAEQRRGRGNARRQARGGIVMRGNGQLQQPTPWWQNKPTRAQRHLDSYKPTATKRERGHWQRSKEKEAGQRVRGRDRGRGSVTD